ncbi:MurR/RpiR family transcriptional regulator [Clostridium sp. AF18-27]|uniref:Transcriptional regulator, RpiR family n=1 Tax=Enterocloster lavalensis TaxID=460384 RepID=A0A1I0JR40_9FIRM|nr:MULTISPECIES: MurR/RpiR family transcriptional regulator [Enterocloster]RHR48795.1 MurR/RpiR family transcriptional regulator [Clostridium sp. AF18-27]MCB6343420.1 MurR/RpiR family transcriptional regulator [Enterocloster lavalensis]MDR3758250.1 MurR/RpiR family transcriptional regulator [Enterocloster sp.]PST31299.1 MurR/RpiR family transcriptional regulator [Enterocloster lavalensis]SEU13143.1 transcriptional regulator, RpiR family [Enterocloster lavalensis]
MQETRSVLGAICSSYDTFFEAEKKIADYMMENKAAVVDMTVGELARASGTSDATVSRFCRRCGFKGFHNLKLTLAREVLEDEQKDQSVSNDIDRGDIRQSLQNILANKVAELTETVNMMDADNLEQILSRLENARMVQLAAVGNTIPVAMDGAFKLNQLGIPAVAGEIWETQAAYTFNLGPEDVVLIISNSGSSRRLQSLAQGARENRSTVIVITNNPDSPLARISDYRIVTATREKLLTEEFWFSRVTATAVMEILYLLLLNSKKDAVEHIRRHEKVISPDKQ